MTVRGPHELLLCLRQILTTEKFADVTIYCSGRKLRAHKLLLSASSPYLQKLLSINNSGNEESFIIIDSIAYEDMKSLLEFMYTGGTRVREERIELFLEAARALDVRVLCGEDYGKARVPNKKEDNIGIIEDQIMTSDLRMISIDKIRDTIERNVRDEVLDTRTLANGVPAVPWVQPWMTPPRCYPYSRTYGSSPTSPHCALPSFPQQIQASTPPPARSAPLPSVPYVLASTPPPPRSAPPLATSCLAATVSPPSRSVPHLLPLKTRPGGIVTPCPWAQHGLPPLGLPPRRIHLKSECKIEKEPLLTSSPDVREEEATECIKTTPPASDLRPTNGKKLYALKERRLQEFYREQRLNGETKKEIKEESESECSSDISQEDKNNNNVINGAKRCGECGLLLGSREALVAHGLAEHGKGCSANRSSEASTGSQISNVSDPLVRCKECGLEFTTEKALTIHVTTHHSLSDLSDSQCAVKDSSGPARCEDCGLEFSSGEALAGHGKAAHGKPYTCMRCSKQFVHRGHWAAHQRLHVEPKQQHPCSHCPKIFLTRASLKVHIRTHTGEKPFQCTDCGKQFSQLRNYKYHRSVHEGTREFAATCPECGKYFNDRGYLSSHMKIHRNRKEYACEYCGKSFNQRVAYNMHVRIHTGLKPHSCPHCPKSFSRKMLLKQHLRIHTGEKPFSCVVCGKAFADRSNMTLHMRLHSGVKPYSCNLCSKAFTKKHHLKTHMNYHTGVKPYSCGKCGLKFSQSSNMRTHFKKCNAPSPTPSRDISLPQPPPELSISSSS